MRVPLSLRKVLPPWLRQLRHLGTRHLCPMCGTRVRKFLPNAAGRPNVRCPHCNASDRQRFLWLYFSRCSDLFDGTPRKLLHFAPEGALGTQLQKDPRLQYLSVDITPGRAMMVADITGLQFADAEFDRIICSHVLEHIPDDFKAMCEMLRVLRPGGVAYLMFPLVGDTTFEDFSVTDHADRKRLFGRHDHVRVYGMDVLARLRGCGWNPQVEYAREMLEPVEIRRYGILTGELLMRCTPAFP